MWKRMSQCLAVIVILISFVLHPSAASSQVLLREVPLPKTLSLCGEPMPLENRAVSELLDRELTFLGWDHAQVFMWIKRAGRFFPMIEEKLREAGMPDDLKYLAVAESSLLNEIRSVAGAVGPWQFIPQTGSHHGLRKDQFFDERLDFERSTEAAIKYLRSLREMFGSWTLALAAYNCGEARLKKDMDEQKVAEYYRLDLARETERFIFRIAAIKVILQNPEQYGYIVDQDRIYRPIPSDSLAVRVQTPMHMTNLAVAIGTDYKVIRELNPHIVGSHLPVGSYSIRVPQGLGPRTAEILSQRIRVASQKVEENPERSKQRVAILPEQKPLIEQASVGAAPQPELVQETKVEPQRDTRSKTAVAKDQFYVVRPGDTLSLISNKKKVPVDVLRKLNGIEGSRITVGQKLRLTT
jgi:membrane-bound lytic murein transglycosylase D